MEADKKNSFGWLLSVIAILFTGLIVLEGILLRFLSQWEWCDVRLVSVIFMIILWVVPYAIVSIRLKGFEKKEPREEALRWIGFVSAADSLFLLSLNDVFPTRWFWWFYPLIILMQTYGMYSYYQKRQKRNTDEVEREKELLALFNETMRSDQKTCIVISNASQKDIQFEMNDHMSLYSLPDGQFLILFQERVGLEAFQQAVAAFQSIANTKDDVIGYYRYPGPVPLQKADPVLF